MPTSQPFTVLCQTLGRPLSTGRVDLHLHSTFSDGSYSPAQLVDLARRAGLAAIALTDHDTLAGIPAARQAAVGTAVEVIAGVEITADHLGRELHLLGFFIDLDAAPLHAALDRLCVSRRGRFWEMVERLRSCGLSITKDDLIPHLGPGVLGRRQLAELLVKLGHASTIREVFARYLGDRGRATVPKERLPVAEAISLVRAAGGVAAWAHPSYHGDRDSLRTLKELGMDAVEAEYPAHRPALVRELRRLAGTLDMAVSGGSDCHGPEPAGRMVGACGVTKSDLELLRAFAAR